MKQRPKRKKLITTMNALNGLYDRYRPSLSRMTKVENDLLDAAVKTIEYDKGEAPVYYQEVIVKPEELSSL
ncbi:hypothetical protein [Legionella clemsonensis]|uniref:Uncharacterized protein n=1 Tax=Legionella clemsonensis TaxID=1867846 RepID=A0A222NZ05_9GAMM|nr:hypothetical protein [Legionella clemsonensis]ASQ44830.1 hypothetical protein clem_01320 [Legionella clemsonensis]